MKSKKRGKNTLKCEVTNVSPFGIWILFADREYFLDHKKFPWFKQASVEEVLKVAVLSDKHLRWPLLDIDLHLDSITDPERFPLAAKAQPDASEKRRRSA